MRRPLVLLAVCVALVASGVASVPAVAAPADGPTVITVTATRSSAGGLMAVQNVITCTIQINNPHKSHHVPGKVNITATWQCSQAVPRLDITLYMYRGGLFVTQSTTFVKLNNTYIQGNVAAPCVTGSYMGVAIGNVTFPAGYTPPTGQESVYNDPSVYISC